jgi:hypothetical protein
MEDLHVLNKQEDRKRTFGSRPMKPPETWPRLLESCSHRRMGDSGDGREHQLR